MSFHLFFEGGIEDVTRYDQVPGTPFTGAPTGSDFVFRAGVGYDYTTAGVRNLYGTQYSVFLTGEKGRWPVLGGNITRPENLMGFSNDVMNSPPGWWLMAYLKVSY